LSKYLGTALISDKLQPLDVFVRWLPDGYTGGIEFHESTKPVEVTGDKLQLARHSVRDLRRCPTHENQPRGNLQMRWVVVRGELFIFLIVVIDVSCFRCERALN